MKIFINGFGRIGRTVLRQVLSGHKDVQIVGINDIAPLDTCAYLFRYDSVYGPFPGEVTSEQDALVINGQRIPFANTPDLSTLDLKGVDIVMECTGKAGTRAIATRGLTVGANRVLISGPSDAADQTIVLGANDHELTDARIISNASCTTNAIAPLLKTLDDAFGITHGHITTIHCYTGSQPTVDAPGPSFERSRAAAVSMVPTTTSAANQIARILPEIDGRLSVSAVRVPCISVSSVDAVLQLRDTPTEDATTTLDACLKENPVIGITHDPCVSSDLRARPESLIVALPETQWIGATQLRLLGWYDNEWGFSARMIDVARAMTA
ncbi:glyceraldehyde 3-phosphate dehydrogenase NAD-binding domain-containing protein [Tateyamaria sp. ANG-S1]|uniref:type I glyceraldehyde-3-phosphate dehydrogenase n=1 Tax=Tateyamaria sp. ANG-S1 TaxID=1577905 RepID=UPI00057C6ABE|nr:glyceraldehyde 3-phosphate dehydrogenase NAD-binding domain-containing protein [Tateyamaria sp. ANG-S1]KIC47707.1 glyceraldehyde-3-phosphate dehydrogenase [Tateyamaria sp. ANG-S1]